MKWEKSNDLAIGWESQGPLAIDEEGWESDWLLSIEVLRDEAGLRDRDIESVQCSEGSL